MDNIVKEIGDRFLKEIDKKNGWGKKEIEKLYLHIAYDVMSEYLNKGDNNDS